MGRKEKIFSKFTVISLFLFLVCGVCFAVNPVPGTYNPETLSFYNGAPMPNFIEEPAELGKHPSKGTNDYIVIMMHANDEPATFTANDFDELLFSVGSVPTGSFREFYLEVSYGQFEPVGDIYGWYMADHEYNYYTEGNYGFDGGAREFVHEAIDKAEADGVNFADYDNDNDGEVDGVIIIHQGKGGEGGDPNDFWSHRGWCDREYDGVIIQNYSINPELQTPTQMESIGVFCHEFGHQLGLPDLYDTDYSGDDNCGKWGLMDSGSYNRGGTQTNPAGSVPAHLMGWCRAQLGWVTPVEITGQGAITECNPIQETNDTSIYKITFAHTPDEYFLLENRWNDADCMFDKRGSAYSSGIIISHCYDNGSSSSEYRYCKLVDSSPDINGYRDSPYYQGKQLTLNTDPNSDGYFHETGIIVHDFSPSGACMSFSVMLKPVIWFDELVSFTETGVENEYELIISLQNIGNIALNNATATICESSDQVVITKQTASFPSIGSEQSQDNSSDPFRYQVTPTGLKGEHVYFGVTVEGTGYTNEDLEFLILINPSDILFIDDDQGNEFRDESQLGDPKDYETYFYAALDSISGLNYDVWENCEVGRYIDPSNLYQYKHVIWNAAEVWRNALDDTEEALLATFLDQGGNLYLNSQEYLYQRFKYQGGEDYKEVPAGTFAHDYLHVTGVEHDEYYYEVHGIDGNPITDGMDANLEDVYSPDPSGAGDYQWWPDNIAVADDAEVIFNSGPHDYPPQYDPEYYDSTEDLIPEGPCALMYPKQGGSSMYRVVFTAFGIEGMPTNCLTTFLENVIAFFEEGSQPDFGTTIWTNQAMYNAGDNFGLYTLDTNTYASTIPVAKAVVLDVYGEYWFHPHWGQDFQYETVSLPPESSETATILEFVWPSGAGSADGIMFWAALLNPDDFSLLGTYGNCTFGWSE